MKLKILAANLLLLAGCAHRAHHYAPPDFAPMQASYTKAVQAVTSAKQHLAAATASLKAAQSDVADEGVKIATLQPQLQNLLRASPAELRDQVDAALSNVEDLQDEHARLVPEVATSTSEAAAALVQVAAADAALAQHAKDMAAVQAAAIKNTDAANTAEQGWAHDSQVATHLILHSLWFRLLGGLAFVAVAIVALLYFTNTLGTKAAAVAAKIP